MFIFKILLLSICHSFYTIYFKLINDKTQPTSTILIIDPYSHTHPYINVALNVYLINQILEQYLNLLFFPWITNFIMESYNNMIIIYIHVTNPVYFLIINLYKVYYIYSIMKHSIYGCGQWSPPSATSEAKGEWEVGADKRPIGCSN